MKNLRFTLVVLLVVATFSYQLSSLGAAAAAPVESTPTSLLVKENELASTASNSEWTTSEVGDPVRWSHIPWKDLEPSFVNALLSARDRLLDETVRNIGLPISIDTYGFLSRAIHFIYYNLNNFFMDSQQKVDMVMEWIIDSSFNPFKSIKNGMNSFRVLFRFLHKLRKGSKAGFGMDNPIYRCYLKNHPRCVAFTRSDIVYSFTLHQYYCAWLFFERCSIHYWWKKGMWRAPNVNGENWNPPKS